MKKYIKPQLISNMESNAIWPAALVPVASAVGLLSGIKLAKSVMEKEPLETLPRFKNIDNCNFQFSS